MEIAGAVVACLAAITLGFSAGRLWAREPVWCIPIGIVVGIACAFGYLAALVAAAELLPVSLDAHALGIRFLVLLPIVPLFAVPAAWFGYRKSIGIRLF